jgi:hypothetical protein
MVSDRRRRGDSNCSASSNLSKWQTASPPSSENGKNTTGRESPVFCIRTEHVLHRHGNSHFPKTGKRQETHFSSLASWPELSAGHFNLLKWSDKQICTSVQQGAGNVYAHTPARPRPTPGPWAFCLLRYVYLGRLKSSLHAVPSCLHRSDGGVPCSRQRRLTVQRMAVFIDENK